MSVLLSICIPTYNRVCQLKNQLLFFENEGVFEDKRIQFIVSDNHSNDGTDEYLKQFALKHTISVYRQKKNIGGVSNIVVVQKHAKGKYIWIPGDDDILSPGLVNKIFQIIEKYKDIGHIFINHSMVKKEKIEKELYYCGRGGFFNDGFSLFKNVAEKGGLGGMMFQTANIYRRELVVEANAIIKRQGEYGNYAKTLGYSLFCSSLPGYIIQEPLVKDELQSISWKNVGVLVWCRDMIAICDIIGEAMGMGDEVRKIITNNLPRMCPEYEYFFRGHKFKKNNYALEMYRRHYKQKLIIDALIYPFYTLWRILRKISPKYRT